MNNKKHTMYLKVTEACNLKCPFCYVPQQPIFMTNEIAFNAIDTYNPEYIIFHGGEPLLHPQLILDVMEKYPEKEYSLTSNMVITIGEQQRQVLEKLKHGNVATSYSIDRFYNPKDYEIFKQQIKLLTDYTLIVTLTPQQISQSPSDFIKIIEELNPKFVDIERMSIINIQEKDLPLYQQMDNYLTEVFKILPKEKNVLYLKMKESLQYNIPVYNPNCSQSMITINADGSTIGCPNSCVSTNQEKRSPLCFSCDIFEYCGGDCETFHGACKFPKYTFLKVQNGEL